MLADSESLFDPRAWTSALEKHAAVVHMTVQLYDPAGVLVHGTVFPTPLFDLVACHGAPSEFSECAARCLAQPAGTSEIVVVSNCGIAVVGAPFRLADKIVGVAVAGYSLTEFPDRVSVERFSREHALPYGALWSLIRSIPPVHSAQLRLQGELLQVLGEGLLREREQSSKNARLYREAQKANQLKDEFLSTVTHELRTPLHAIMGWVHVGQQRKDDQAIVGRAFDTIERNAKAQVHIIEDLLDISRVVTGKLRLALASTDLASLLDDALDAVRPAAQAKQITISHKADESIGAVEVDAARLQQALWNLLSNAVKFTPVSGRVEVKLRRVNDSKLAIAVSDTGEGISAEFIPHIFERFRQSDNSPSRYHSGLGLGLSIARSFVELHGGTVNAESPGPGRGATFTIELPIRGEHERATDRRSLDLTEHEPSQINSGAQISANMPPHAQILTGLVVLLVDDSVDGRDALAELLEGFGARVVAVGSAPEALATLESAKPQILIADIGLPDEDGYSLMRKVRARAPQQGGAIPAVALTGYVQEKDRQRAISAGFQHYLTKPVQVMDLVSVLAGLTGKEHASNIH